MARGGGGGDRDRDRRRSPKDSGRRPAKKKVCIFCSEHIEWVDYKDVNVLRRFMSDRGKIRARRVSGNCAQHQRDVAVAIKTARELALLPYSQRTVAERGGGRGGRGGRDDRDDRGPRPDRDNRDREAESTVDGGAVAEVPVGAEDDIEVAAVAEVSEVSDVVTAGAEEAEGA
jgi:small subunit ribosomal protein S18